MTRTMQNAPSRKHGSSQIGKRILKIIDRCMSMQVQTILNNAGIFTPSQNSVVVVWDTVIPPDPL